MQVWPGKADLRPAGFNAGVGGSIAPSPATLEVIKLFADDSSHFFPSRNASASLTLIDMLFY